VPSLAWVEATSDNNDWLGPYLEQIRLVVVDQLGVRGPYSGDPLEEAACVELSRLVEPRAVEIEQAYRELEGDDPFSGIPEDPARAARKKRAVEEFETFLERRDLGDGRLLVALGRRAPDDSLGEGPTSDSMDLHRPRYNFDLARGRTLREGVENPSPLWVRGVPSLAWVEPNADNHDWLGPYLGEIRLVVVDRSGVRGPYSGDPLEEAACVELSKLVEPKAAAIEEAYRARGYRITGERTVVEFESFLEWRDLGDGRLLVALGYRAPDDFLEDGPTPCPIELRGHRYSFDLPRWWLGEVPECPNTLWLRGVPALEWVEATADNHDWIGPYLEKIRLVVVDQPEVRAPRASDPLEEAACVELAKLIEPNVVELNKASRAINLMLKAAWSGEPWGMWVEFQVREKRAIENFQRFLEIRAISHTRFVVALGCRASADALAELGPFDVDAMLDLAESAEQRA
jgi:hypothetical protein